jgi:hypothetical protein
MLLVYFRLDFVVLIYFRRYIAQLINFQHFTQLIFIHFGILN